MIGMAAAKKSPARKQNEKIAKQVRANGDWQAKDRMKPDKPGGTFEDRAYIRSVFGQTKAKPKATRNTAKPTKHKAVKKTGVVRRTK